MSGTAFLLIVLGTVFIIGILTRDLRILALALLASIAYAAYIFGREPRGKE